MTDQFTIPTELRCTDCGQLFSEHKPYDHQFRSVVNAVTRAKLPGEPCNCEQAIDLQRRLTVLRAVIREIAEYLSVEGDRTAFSHDERIRARASDRLLNLLGEYNG